MRSTFLRPCLPTSGKTVPATSDWLHEVKYDGYRLIVASDGKRVRLITRGGYDWASQASRLSARAGSVLKRALGGKDWLYGSSR